MGIAWTLIIAYIIFWNKDKIISAFKKLIGK